jgi:L-ascorbate 6-phosphate lactonase
LENKWVIQYLGQAGFHFSSMDFEFLVDPYLSNYVVSGGFGDAVLFKREFAPPVDPEVLRNISFILVTHDHADHCDPLTLKPILKNNPGCQIIGPISVERALISSGVAKNRIIVPKVNSDLLMGPVCIHPIPSAHYGLDQDPDLVNYLFFGFVFKFMETIFYHSGDTILYPDLVSNLQRASHNYDYVMLPVNGRDARREKLGMVGNLTMLESMDLASQVHARYLIPMHNDLFKVNQVDPDELKLIAKNYNPKQDVLWLEPGEIIKLD